MEGKVTEILDRELFECENTTEEIILNEKLNELISENLISKKTVEELIKDEEMLTCCLNKLKKDNFKLETILKAWKTTLENKLDEFKETDLKLDGVYNEIQSERENFCSKLDKFNEEYGVLSTWWEKQMNFITQLEEKSSEEEKCKEEVKQLEKDIEDVKKEIGLLQAEKQQVYLSQEEETFVRTPEEEISPERFAIKKLKLSEEECEEIVLKENELKTSQAFYSLVDMEKVRLANRRRNQQW